MKLKLTNPEERRPHLAERYASSKKIKMLAWSIVGLGALFYAYEYFLRIAPSVMSKQLMHAYHISADGFGKMIAFYYFAYTPMQIFVGVLLDRYGARLLLTIAAICCALGALLFVDATGLGVAELGRFLVGFGSAFAFVGALKLASIWLPPESFASISGMIAAIGTLGAMVGDIVLTKFVQFLGWEETTFIWAFVGLGLAVLIFLVVRDAADPHPDTSYLPPLTFRTVFRALWHALSKLQFWINGIIGALAYLAMSVFAELWGIPYLEQAYHIPESTAAASVMLTFLGWTVGGPIMGMISDKLKLRRPVLMVGSLGAAICIALAIYGGPWPIYMFDVLFFLFGAFASAQVVVFAIGREVADRQIAGTAIALTNMFVMLGGVLFQPLIGTLLDFHWGGGMSHQVRLYTLSDYRFALSVLPLAMVGAFVLTLFMKETHCVLHLDEDEDTAYEQQ